MEFDKHDSSLSDPSVVSAASGQLQSHYKEKQEYNKSKKEQTTTKLVHLNFRVKWWKGKAFFL
jgi:hypothetical protein